MPISIETAKRLIKKHTFHHGIFISESETADQYYHGHNAIEKTGAKKIPPSKYERDADGQLIAQEVESPMQRADERISSAFYPLIVSQKASYAFTAPPTFDVHDDGRNAEITKLLGDRFPKICKNLCTAASNDGVSWLHYWVDNAGAFKYSLVPAVQILPVYTSDLDDELDAVLRVYQDVDESDGGTYDVYEYWTSNEVQSFRKRNDSDIDTGLMPFYEFSITFEGEPTGDAEDIRIHELGRVPFIPFRNNDTVTGDLWRVKGLIDAYDIVYSGFLNDLEDVQQVILIISGYDGENLNEFLNKLKTQKVVKVDANEDNKNPGLSKLSIEIPVEARKEMLTMTRKSIFEQGMGIDPDPQNFGNSSGVALKYLYSLLELKTGIMETEFRIGFADLIRAICQYKGWGEPDKIIQTWTRTSVNNDSELVQIAQQSTGVISKATIVKNHPWVDDPDAEMEQIEKEEEPKSDAGYEGAFKQKDVNNEPDSHYSEQP